MLATAATVKYKPRSRLPLAADRNSSTVLHEKGTAQVNSMHGDVNTTVLPVAVTQLLKSPQPVSPQEPVARPLLFTTPTDQQQRASPVVTPMNINSDSTLKDPQDILTDKIASYVASSGSLSPDSKVSQHYLVTMLVNYFLNSFTMIWHHHPAQLYPQDLLRHLQLSLRAALY